MSEFQIRMATAGDAEVLAHYRCAMFQDMGLLPAGPNEAFDASSAAFFREALGGASWYGWVVCVGGSAIGGAAMHLSLMPPRTSPHGVLADSRLQGLIMNIYVEPEWRRRGIASALMDRVLDFAREKRAASVTLHASQKGKPLYEKMGFLPTHEMRLFL